MTVKLMGLGLASAVLVACGGTDDKGCATELTGAGYCLLWADEFNGTQLNESAWSYEQNCYGGGNGEAQCYVKDAKNLWLADGYLHIAALREDVTGPALFDDHPNYQATDTSGTGTYSSARIRTKHKQEFRYGRFEMRAKLPAGQGTWPAFWMLPSDEAYGGWAASGEIDIMEAINLDVGGEAQVHGTLHYGEVWPNNVYSGEAYTVPGSNPAHDFHVYALEWEQGEIRWYVDGDHYASQTSAGWYSANALDNPFAPFDQPFHLLINFAVGGSWPEAFNDTGIDEAAFPQQMLVDYVRVYQCVHDPITGLGCASRDDDFVLNPGVAP